MSDPRRVLCDRADFFGFSISRSLALRIFGQRRIPLGLKAVVLSMSSKRVTDADSELPARTALVSYPDSVEAMFDLLLGEEDAPDERDRVEVLLPKAMLTDLAEGAGAEQILHIKLGAGIAANDPIMESLQECFSGLRALGSSNGDALAEQVGEALTTHLAERYGGMRKATERTGGGLAPWQLRLARRSLNNLDVSVPLTDIARECGLSGGHFARAFKRSTGMSPHQWNVQRRIEAAKEMLSTGIPLAEVAIACRFSDQSHLTRAFSQATGKTPGRWRMENALALSQ